MAKGAYIVQYMLVDSHVVFLQLVLLCVDKKIGDKEYEYSKSHQRQRQSNKVCFGICYEKMQFAPTVLLRRTDRWDALFAEKAILQRDDSQFRLFNCQTPKLFWQEIGRSLRYRLHNSTKYDKLQISKCNLIFEWNK